MPENAFQSLTGCEFLRGEAVEIKKSLKCRGYGCRQGHKTDLDTISLTD